MSGWWWKGVGCFLWEGWQQRALWYPLHLISVLVWHPLCVVYIHRIGSALHTNKILLLIIGAPQKSANQSDEDNKAGWVARTPWVPQNVFLIIWMNSCGETWHGPNKHCHFSCAFCRPPEDDRQLHRYGHIHHPVRLDHWRAGLL